MPSGSQVVTVGAARLRVPAAYQAIAGDPGQVFLQAAPPATAVIQVTVISAPPGADQPLPAADLIRAHASQRGRPVQDLGNGKIITSYDETGDQDGRRVFVRFVEVGLAGRLAVIAVAVPESDLHEAENKAVMGDLPGIVQSFEPADSDATPAASQNQNQQEEPPVRSGGTGGRRPFDDTEVEQLAQCLQFADGLLGKYGSFKKETTPELLDSVFSRWLDDADREKADAESVALAIGAAFGEIARKHLGMKWVIVGDEGSDQQLWALSSPRDPMLLFPIESVRTRIADRRSNFLHDLYRTAQRQFGA